MDLTYVATLLVAYLYLETRHLMNFKKATITSDSASGGREFETKRVIKFLRSRGFWALLIVVSLAVPTFVFFQNRYVGTSQDFGPVDTSSLGGTSPFRQVDIRLSCSSKDGSYISDIEYINCQILVKSKNQSLQIADMEFGVLVANLSGQTIKVYNATAHNITSDSWTNAVLTTSDGSSHLELPSGDYKISIQQFGIMGGGVLVTKAKPVQFRGELHVMSDFDKRTRLSQDGAALATFLAFIFIIPTTLMAIRSFLLQKE
jgi:hypothetical protein